MGPPDPSALTSGFGSRWIAFSLEHRALVLLLAGVVFAVGVWRLPQMPVDVFPDLQRPTVTILTESKGLSTEEVEASVTRSVEQSIAGTPGIERTQSRSTVGLSVVTAEFDWTVDRFQARQRVEERLALAAAELPDGIRPVLGPLSSVMGEVLLLGVVSPDSSVDGLALRRWADRSLRPALLAVPGVSQVTAIGGGVENVEVVVNPQVLATRGVSLAEVREATAEAQGNGSGGFLAAGGEEHIVRALAQTRDPALLRQTTVTVVEGTPIRLGEVAVVQQGVGVRRGDAGVDGKNAVILSVQKQPGANTLTITQNIEPLLDRTTLAPPNGVEVIPLFRQAGFIDAAIANVQEALRDGAILVLLVVLAFLVSWRSTLVSLAALPLSFISATLILDAFGMGINTMTLGGLAVAAGELVDDAIVDVENVHRRLRENALRPQAKPALDIIRAASGEVRGAIVFSTVLVALVFVPLLALNGIEGRMFAPMGIAYITSILASMVVSLLVTPALASVLLRADSKTDPVEGRLVRVLKRLEGAILEVALDRPASVAAIAALCVLAAGLSLPFLGSRFLPAFNEGTVTINMLARPGIDLTESSRWGAKAEMLLLAVPEVLHIGRRTGRAELDEHAEGVHSSEIDVEFRSGGRAQGEVLRDLRDRLSLLPGATFNIGQPIEHRLDHMLSGVRAAIAVKLFGEDLLLLRKTAEHLKLALRTVPGLVDVQIGDQTEIPQVHIDINREQASRFGIRPGALAKDVETLLYGSSVAQIPDGLRSVDLVVRAVAARTLDDLRQMPVLAQGAETVTLGQVAEVREGRGPNEILHENGMRRLVLSANTQDRSPGEVARDVAAVIESERKESIPAEVRVVVVGSAADQARAAKNVGYLGLLALAGMYGVLYTQFRSHRLVLQVLINIPLAAVGAVASIWLSGGVVSIATWIGFITLCGIASRNSVLMLSHYRHLHEVEGLALGRELVVRGTLDRVVPVAMTALCAGLALLPLALAGGEPGKEILTPVAQVILGGLVSSTLLDFVVTPTLFAAFIPKMKATLES